MNAFSVNLFTPIKLTKQSCVFATKWDSTGVLLQPQRYEKNADFLFVVEHLLANNKRKSSLTTPTVKQ